MKNLFLAGVFSFGVTVLYAQSFGVGSNAGLTFSTLDVKTNRQHEYSFTEGWHVDVYAYKMFNGFIGIESGVMLIQTGYLLDREAIGDLYVDPIRTKMTYFSIPVSARLRFGNFKNRQGYFVINPGIRPSFLLKSKQENANQAGYNLATPISGYDLSLFVTPGVQFSNGVSIHSTLAYGLMDVIVHQEDFKSKSFVLQFSVGYAFFRQGDE